MWLDIRELLFEFVSIRFVSWFLENNGKQWVWLARRDGTATIFLEMSSLLRVAHRAERGRMCGFQSSHCFQHSSWLPRLFQADGMMVGVTLALARARWLDALSTARSQSSFAHLPSFVSYSNIELHHFLALSFARFQRLIRAGCGKLLARCRNSTSSTHSHTWRRTNIHIHPAGIFGCKLVSVQ